MSSLQLARFGANTALYGRYYGGKARAAARIGKFVWKHRSKFKQAAKKLRTERGVRAQTRAYQSSIPQGPGTQLQMGRLYVQQFQYPELDATFKLRQRERNTIFIKGFKVCRHFHCSQGQATIGEGRIEVHWALLQSKSDCVTYPSGLATGDLTTKFFSSRDLVDKNHTEFDSYNSVSGWQMSLNCLPINPNSDWKVLTHRKKRITGAGTNGFGGNYIWHINKYFKVGKRFKFDEDTNTLPDRPIFEVFWYNFETPLNFPADPTAINYVTTDHTNTTYWKQID